MSNITMSGQNAAVCYVENFDEKLTGEERKRAINDFKAGAEWQKEQIKNELSRIQGMQLWIKDKEMAQLFGEVINNILIL